MASSSWIVFDATGQGSILDAYDFEIMSRFGIYARELRVLDPMLSYPSTITVRPNTIVLNLEHIKAIITAEKVLLRDPTNEMVIPVVQEFQRRLSPSGCVQRHQRNGNEYILYIDETPRVFRALEVTLEAICSFHASCTLELEKTAYPVLDDVTSKTSSHNLDEVDKIKSETRSLMVRVQEVRGELELLLKTDDDMADLCSSRENYVQLEMLLKAYLGDIDNTLNRLNTILFVVNSGNVCLSFSSLVAALFGMKIPYPWNNNHGYMFKWVVFVTKAVSAKVKSWLASPLGLSLWMDKLPHEGNKASH